jgi:hypothetical protein
MTMRKSLLLLAYTAVVIVVLFIVLGKARGPDSTLIWREALNFGHVPLFGLVSLALLGIASIVLGDKLAPQRHYAIALSWAVFLGGVSELLQVYIDRNASLVDFVRNLAGAVSALALAATVDRRFGASGPWKRESLKWVLRAVASLILLAALSPVVIAFEVHRQRDSRFPYLFRFASRLELPLIRAIHATIELTAPPSDWEIGAQRYVGKVSCQAVRYPGVAFHEFHQDWGAFRYLDLDLYLAGEPGVTLVVRIEDDLENPTYHDRYNGSFDLQPGPTHLHIPLDEVRAAPKSHDLNMRRIKKIIIFVRKPGRPVTFYLSDLKLSGDSSPIRP